jgi:hypothetical protein
MDCLRMCHNTASLNDTDSDETILSTSNIPAGNSRARYRPQLEETTIAWRGNHSYLTGRLPHEEQLPPRPSLSAVFTSRRISSRNSQWRTRPPVTVASSGPSRWRQSSRPARWARSTRYASSASRWPVSAGFRRGGVPGARHTLVSTGHGHREAANPKRSGKGWCRWRTWRPPSRRCGVRTSVRSLRRHGGATTPAQSGLASPRPRQRSPRTSSPNSSGWPTTATPKRPHSAPMSPLRRARD